MFRRAGCGRSSPLTRSPGSPRAGWSHWTVTTPVFHRGGRQVNGAGIFRDAVRSTARHGEPGPDHRIRFLRHDSSRSPRRRRLIRPNRCGSVPLRPGHGSVTAWRNVLSSPGGERRSPWRGAPSEVPPATGSIDLGDAQSIGATCRRPHATGSRQVSRECPTARRPTRPRGRPRSPRGR